MKHFPERTARRRLLEYLFSVHRVSYPSVAAAVKRGVIDIEQWIDLLDAHQAGCRPRDKARDSKAFEPSAFARAVIEHDALRAPKPPAPPSPPSPHATPPAVYPRQRSPGAGSRGAGRSARSGQELRT